MDKKILLIDGHSIINRAFYGVPDLTNSEGLHTNAIYGFLNIFFSAYNNIKPDYVLVAFDVKQKTFRHEMFDAYKGNRNPMPEELREQVPVLQDVLRAMNISIVTLPGFEADDVLGTYARKAEADGLSVVVLSGDRDLLQLATEKTMISLAKTKGGKTEYEEYFAKDVLEKKQVTPSEFIDVKALMGDTSDNIPGVPGIGEKTATSIIVNYHSLENAIEHIEEIKPNKARENLKEYESQALLSKTLATIDTNAPVPLDYKESLIEKEEVFYNNDSYGLFKKLELNRLLSRFDPVKMSSDNEVNFAEKELDEFLAEDIKADSLGLFVSNDLSLISVCMPDENITVFSSAKSLSKAPSSQLSFSFAEKADKREEIIKLLCSGKKIYTFNLKDLLHAVKYEGAELSNIYDVSIMAYLLNPLSSSYTYDAVSKDYLELLLPSKTDLIGKQDFSLAFNISEYSGLCKKISAYSAFTALKAFPLLEEKLGDNGMLDLFYHVEMPLIFSLYFMEKAGVIVDKERLMEFSALLSDKKDALEKEIYSEAGEEFNINSPQQLGVVLFEKLKLPAGKKTKTGYSTSADILEKLALDYPFVSKILEYRQIAKLKSTYADGLQPFIKSDGRIHGTFNQTITATGRISSTEPNLQNIPIRMELGQEVRRAFVAEEGFVFLDADYSQIELRLLAHFSNDEKLIEAYNSEADIHRMTASKVFNIPYDEVTKEQRRNAKAVNFGIVYGISSFGLSRDLNMTRKEASDYIKQYFETYPGVKKYLDDTVRKAKIDGYVTTLFGRVRPVPELSSSNFMQRSFGERVAMNSPLQGTAADIMKIAMNNVCKRISKNNLKSRVVLQVHDELLVETAADEIEAVKTILEEEMKNAADLKVPLEVEVSEGKDWFEAH